MRKIITLILGLAFTLGAYAQVEGSYAYVTKQNVNLREGPSTSSKAIGKANLGDIHPIEEKIGDWYVIEISEGPDSWYPCISAQFVKVLNSNEMTPEALSSSYSFDDGGNYGMLEFEKDKTDEWGNDWYRFNILVKNRQMQEQGGSGVIENRSESVLYIGNSIMNPEDYVDYPVVYDKSQNLLWYAGYLWKKD